MKIVWIREVQTDLEEYGKWNLVSPRRPNVKIGDKNKKSVQSN